MAPVMEAADLPPPEMESLLSSLVYNMSQQVQTAMENMLKMINENDQNSAGQSAVEWKKGLEEQKDRFQKAAFAVLDMLNSG